MDIFSVIDNLVMDENGDIKRKRVPVPEVIDYAVKEGRIKEEAIKELNGWIDDEFIEVKNNYVIAPKYRKPTKKELEEILEVEGEGNWLLCEVVSDNKVLRLISK